MTAPSSVVPGVRFELRQMLGTGEDGSVYLGSDGQGTEVLVHRLTALTQERRLDLEHRFKLRQLLSGQEFLEVHQAQWEGPEALLVTERVSGSLAQLLAGGRLEREDALRLAHGVATALASAHRVGLWHLQLSPARVFLRSDMTVALDFLSPHTGLAAVDARGVPPQSELPSPGVDAYGLGVLLSLMLTGSGPRSSDETETGVHGAPKDDLKMLLKELVDAEPSWRPSAEEAALRLARLQANESPASDAPTLNGRGEPTRLGRFELKELLGKGAMGRVYRALDLADGSAVAVKLLEPASTSSLSALRRFRKEARLLAEVRNPYIANLIEANRDQGQYFIAVELADGQDLSTRLKERGPVPEQEAVAIAADVAQALIDVHARGILHRDIKPANIIMLSAPQDGARVKLVDFGIARHIDENASLQLTELGASIGTPVYMSPEQCRGQLLDGKSDIYSLGVTLFALVAGRPPFSGDGGSEAIFARHLFEQAPVLSECVPTASPELDALLKRCLEKEPEKRPDAVELLRELELVLHRDADQPAAHPRRPEAGPQPVSYRFEWLLKASPMQLWPYVSNTDRLNRAVGLGPVEQSFREVRGAVQRIGKSPSWPFSLTWREHPHEWVQGVRLGVLRELEAGPLRWLRNVVDLEPVPTGGTRLVHTVELMPRGLLGRASAAVEVGVRLRLALARVYQRIDELLARQDVEAATLVDAFEAPFQLDADREARLAAAEKRMVERGADQLCTVRLGDHLRHGPPQEVARIRPLALARRLGVDPTQLAVTCLWGVREGVLRLHWDLVCPSCRVPSEVKDTLRAVKEHGRCEVCDLDYALDLASSVELVFSSHPEIRPGDPQLYCLSSPGHMPHVAAQVRLRPGERFELPLQLEEGHYQLAGRHLPFKLSFRVRERAGAIRWDIALSSGLRTDSGRMLAAGRQTLLVFNDTDREQLIRVERARGREDALTASKIAAQPLFRKLFPSEVLAPGELVNVSSVALMMVEVSGDDARPATDSGSFSGRYALFRRLEEKTGIHGGSVVKIAGEGVVAVFPDVENAVRAALGFGADPLPLRVAVHKGPAAALTLDEHVDYFGRTVRETARLLACGVGRELVLSEVAASDPAVAALTAPLWSRAQVDLRLGTPCQRLPLESPPAV